MIFATFHKLLAIFALYISESNDLFIRKHF